MHRHRLIKGKIAPDHIIAIHMAQAIQPLQHIGLFDKAAAQNPIPRPMLVNWPLLLRQGRGRQQFLVQEAILLHAQPIALFVEIHLRRHTRKNRQLALF